MATMIPATEPDRRSAPSGPALLAFHVTNVTRNLEIPVEIGSGIRVDAVTAAIAQRMSLPDDVVWALRDDDTSAFLDEGRAIGDQIAPGAHVTMIPKTHLGAVQHVGAAPFCD